MRLRTNKWVSMNAVDGLSDSSETNCEARMEGLYEQQGFELRFSWKGGSISVEVIISECSSRCGLQGVVDLGTCLP